MNGFWREPLRSSSVLQMAIYPKECSQSGDRRLCYRAWWMNTSHVGLRVRVLELFANQCRGRPVCLPRWLRVKPNRGRHTGLPLQIDAQVADAPRTVPYAQSQTDISY